MKQINRIEIERPSWHETFLDHAFDCAKRSHDAQTKHGAVLVDKHNIIVSDGYNGVMRGVNDSLLPNLRPETPEEYGDPDRDKYLFMIHAEHNAILNAARLGRSTVNTKAYITGKPCMMCLQYMWQAGVSTIIIPKDGTQSHMIEKDKNYQRTFDRIINLTKMKIIEIG